MPLSRRHNTQTVFHSCHPTHLFPLSGPRMRLLCMSVRLYFEAKPVHSVICCCVFVYFLLAYLPSPFTHSVSLARESFLFGQPEPWSSTVQLYWLILIKWPPETVEGSSEYGQALSAAADLPLLTLAFSCLMLNSEKA